MTSRYNYFKYLEPQIRKFSMNMRLDQSKPPNHYDSLGISAKATQADIKSAYYKLSMVYHPDKNSDSEIASQKFRDITEAYEVLGNVKTRKLYDRGLYLGSTVYRPDVRHEEPVNRFYRSREDRSKPPTPHGRRTVYNFDEWSRSHYGATFVRDLKNKQREKMTRMRKNQDIEDIKSEKMILLIGVMLVCIMYAFHGRGSFDQVSDKTTENTNARQS